MKFKVVITISFMSFSLSSLASGYCSGAISSAHYREMIERYQSNPESEHLINFRVQRRDESTIYLNHNTTIINCQNYPGGEAALISELTQTLDYGVYNFEMTYQSIMQKYYSLPRTENNRRIAERAHNLRQRILFALGNFDESLAQHPFEIYCGHTSRSLLDRSSFIRDSTGARSSLCMNYERNFLIREVNLGIVLNLDSDFYFASSELQERRKQMFFHEFLHHTGIKHMRDESIEHVQNSHDYMYLLSAQLITNPIVYLGRLDQTTDLTHELYSVFANDHSGRMLYDEHMDLAIKDL